MEVVNTILPVFLVITLGFVLRKAGFLSSELAAGLNEIVYWVALPCLLFYKISTAVYDFNLAGKTALVVILGMFGCIIVAYIIAVILKVPSKFLGTFVQGSFRGNLAYIGLPVIVYSFSGFSAEHIAKAETIAIVCLAFAVPAYNIFAVLVLLASRHKIDRHAPARILGQIMKNPLIISCVAAWIYSLFFKTIPVTAERTLGIISQMTIPLALFGVGAALARCKIVGKRTFAFATAVIKVGVAPVMGVFCAKLFGLGADETKIALLLLACPTAISSYVLAENIGDGELAATIVIFTTLLSIVSLSLIVALL